MAKKITFTFGRFNPITTGHSKLIKKVVDVAKSTGSEHRIYASKSQDNLKNPLPYGEKIKHMRSLFPSANIHDDPKAHTAFHIAKNLSDEGYDEVTMVVGSDRVDEFRQSIGKYVKDRNAPDFDPKKHYGFKKFNVVSAGDRDPEAEGVEGMSASKMREFARNGDFEGFAKGVPTKNTQLARKIYHSVRKNMQLTEEINHKEFAPHLDSFVSFASDHLGLDSLPNIRFKNEQDNYNSFAAYSPSTNEISISTKGRHPMDIFRSLAHELVHHKQNLDGRIKNVAKEGSTGSDIENEANSEAGIIMRNFAQKNPEHFEMGPLSEETLQEGLNDPSIFKAVFLAGGPGSGKDYILKQTIAGNGMTEINSDVAFEFLLKKNNLSLLMPDHEEDDRNKLRDRAKGVTTEKNKLAIQNRQGLVVNGTAADIKKLTNVKQRLEELGYSTMMVYVDTADEVSQKRNTERGKNGGRTVPENIRKEKWEEAAAAKPVLEKLFGKENFVAIDNSIDLRNADGETVKKKFEEFKAIFKTVRSFSTSPVKHPKAIEWLENQKAERGISKLEPAKAHKFGSTKEKTKPVSKKPDAKPAQAQAQQNAGPPVPSAPTQVPLSNSIMDKARSMGLSYYGFGRFGKNHQITHLERNGQLVAKKLAESLEVNRRFDKFLKEEHGAGEEGTPELTNNYRAMTPGEETRSYPFAKKKKIEEWASDPATIQKFTEKYGSEGAKKLQETTNKLIKAFTTERKAHNGKTLKEFKNESKREEIVKGMKKNFSDFKQRYGDDAKSVMYATATKLAKNNNTKK